MEQSQANTNTPTALFVKMALMAWQKENKKVDDLLEKLSDEDLSRETSPGRNSGVYLLGHLTATNDHLLELFGFEDEMYPELQDTFLEKPEQSGMDKPSVQELRKYWKNVNARLMEHINRMQPEDWFQRHMAVSEEDFVKEPHRNKLNVILNRTSHQSYHLGQMIYLEKK